MEKLDDSTQNLLEKLNFKLYGNLIESIEIQEISIPKNIFWFVLYYLFPTLVTKSGYKVIQEKRVIQIKQFFKKTLIEEDNKEEKIFIVAIELGKVIGHSKIDAPFVREKTITNSEHKETKKYNILGDGKSGYDRRGKK